MVYVTGQAIGRSGHTNFATAAYEAATGHPRWESLHDPEGYGGLAYALAVSTDGTRLFVAGYGTSLTEQDYGTVAYEAGTGNQLWASVYAGPGGAWDFPAAIAASPDGTRVFVTGESYGSGTGYDFATLAYDAEAGSD